MMSLLRYATVAGASLLLFAFAPLKSDNNDPATPSSFVSIDEKLRSIVVSIDMTNAKIDQAVATLAALSKQLDPDHKGIQFVIEPDAAVSGKPVTLKLDNVPLKVALHYVCELSFVHYKVNDHSVFITPWRVIGLEMRERTFYVDPSFVHTAVDAGIIPSPKAP